MSLMPDKTKTNEGQTVLQLENMPLFTFLQNSKQVCIRRLPFPAGSAEMTTSGSKAPTTFIPVHTN